MSVIDKSYTLTDEDINDLMKDWFERDGETYVRATDKHRLGWEKTLGEDDSYSSFFVKEPTKKEAIRLAYDLAKDMMAVVDPPMKVNIKISKGEDSFTDGKTVTLSTKMFDDEELSVGERIDTFLGTTIHEGCHLRYTQFGGLSRVLDYKSYSDDEKQIIKVLANIIEDERIEQLLGEDKPGLTRFLEKSKYFYFDQYYLDFVVPRESEMTDLEKLINTFLYIIRYPKYLKRENITFFGYHLATVKDLVLPYPTDTEDVVDTAVGVYEIFKEFYVEKLREEEEKKMSSEGSGEEGSEGEDAESGSDEGSESGKSSSDSKSDGSDESEGEGESSKGGKGSGSSEVKTMSPEEISEKALDKLLGDSRKIIPKLDKITDDADVGAKSHEVSDELKTREGATFAEELEGTLDRGSSKDSFFSKRKDNKEKYMDSLSRVRRFVPAISKVLKGNNREYKYIHRGMRHGLLDTNKLAEAYQGVPNVYIREGEVKTDKVAIVVLIDESGSMDGSRIVAARDTAVLINEAVGKISNVELYIYGHTGDIRYSGATELSVYREKGYHPKYALGSVAAYSQNRDGTAIMEVAARVRKQTNLPALFFILSDGAPCADGYGGLSAVEHTKVSVQKVEKKGFSVVQVCINPSYDPKTMFTHYVILSDMSSLAFDLGKVIKKATLQNAKNYIV
jgi:uncharacterized protein with von Willebrand factor type A (vWA) domain